MTTTRTREANVAAGLAGWTVRGYVSGRLVSTRWTAGTMQDARFEELTMRAAWLAKGKEVRAA